MTLITFIVACSTYGPGARLIRQHATLIASTRRLTDAFIVIYIITTCRLWKIASQLIGAARLITAARIGRHAKNSTAAAAHTRERSARPNEASTHAASLAWLCQPKSGDLKIAAIVPERGGVAGACLVKSCDLFLSVSGAIRSAMLAFQ
jgi:hypothetical protein